jgi:hypothetical protein
LESTWVGADIAANWDALFDIMDLFRLVSIQVGDYFMYAYPEDLHERVTKYGEHIHQLEPSQPTDSI